MAVATGCVILTPLPLLWFWQVDCDVCTIAELGRRSRAGQPVTAAAGLPHMLHTFCTWHSVVYTTMLCRVTWGRMQVLWTFRQASPFAYDHQRCAGQMLEIR